jgi:hypothetical protein
MTPSRLLLLLSILALPACNAGGAASGGQAQADAQTRAACRQRAEDVYTQQNRAEIYSPPPQVNTPFSANYLPDQSDRGLSQRFAHDRMVNDCIRNTGTGADRTQQPPAKK